MMHGASGLMGTSGDGGASGGSSEVGPSGGGGGNRWPREETLALLKIRSEMEAIFRDSNLKGPLWEQVSRKMAEMGFERSAKKCKEKFENVYKYHKRTKDNRSSKSDGKIYKFFDQIQALQNTPPPPPSHPPAAATIATPPMPIPINSNPLNPPQPPLMNTASSPPQINTFQEYNSNPRTQSPSTSSSSSDEDVHRRRRGRKRKWRDFFQKIMKDVIYKQEELQKKFLETLEKREKDRLASDEAWRAQEISRLNQEHELLAQERSIAAAKDAAVITFLQKVTNQQNPKLPIGNNAPPQSTPPLIQLNPPENPSQPENPEGHNLTAASSSRWPKAEVETLIKIRTSLELKYQENGPKGPLWEEISIEMRKFGYNRNSKRCKEKWENINKYYKKVKESNKKRPEDSKTCPYFHLLDSIHKDRAKNNVSKVPPVMASPERQWPVLDGHGERKDCVMHDDEEEEDEGGGYEVVANEPPSTVVNTAESGGGGV